MAETNSLAFPAMFDVSRNKVSVLSNNASIVNRVRLLLLTEPTELYNNPTFGVGLKQYLFQYNTENSKAIIQDKIKEKLRVFEPSVDADSTKFADGLLFSGSEDSASVKQSYNKLDLTVALSTMYGDSVTVKLNDSVDDSWRK